MPEGSPWVRLRFVLTPDTLFVGYDDSRGRTVRVPKRPTPYAPVAGWVALPPMPGEVGLEAPGYPRLRMLWPERATRLLLGMAAGLPSTREDLHREIHPTTLAVLVGVPPQEPWDPRYEAVARHVLEVVGLSATRSTLAAESRGQTLEPFGLPFVVVTTLPDQGELALLVRRTVGELGNDEVPFAIDVRNASPLDMLDPSDPRPLDVLVTTTLDLVPALSSWWSAAAPPRLIITDDSSGTGAPVAPDTLPAGTSMVEVRGPFPGGTTGFAHAMIRELTHDLPLHEAVAAVWRSLDRGLGDEGLSLHLVTSPSGLDSLRLSTAFHRFRAETAYLLRHRSVGSNVTAPAAAAGVASSERVQNAAQLVWFARDDYLRESYGLSDMARAAAAISLAGPEIQVMDAVGRSILSQPQLAAELAATQLRRVNIWMSRDFTEPDPQVRFAEINRNSVLARGRAYLVNVSVGWDAPNDLLAPETPPIDPILPPVPEGERLLDVAVYSDTSQILDGSARQLRLGQVGPSESVTVRIRTPRRGRSTRIRVLIYFRAHIVQAFSLHISLGATESYEYSNQPAIRTEVDFSRQEQLRDVDDLPRRLLGIAANADGSRDTHRLMFDRAGHSIVLNGPLLQKARGSFRSELGKAFAALDADGHLESGRFDEAIKALAKDGSDRWGDIYDDPGGGEALEAVLDGVRAADHGTVQVLRLDRRFAYPWTTLYDWPLPDSVAAMQAATVCRGLDGEQRCACDATTRGVCVRGFWGIRLVIEELMGQPTVDDYVHSVDAGPGASVVLSTVGITGDAWAADMLDQLSERIGAGQFEDLTEQVSLLTRLWQEHSRPAVLVVVGHLTRTLKPDEPDRTRIYIRSSERWLDTVGLREARMSHEPKRWTQPHRPIVLLLGCDTGSSGLDEVFSFIASLTAAGAASIVATEEKIDTRLAASLATSMVPALGTHGPGEALRSWRAQLMGAGNPLGLLFTCFGSAGARVPALGSNKLSPLQS